jgi:hypothetical protein
MFPPLTDLVALLGINLVLCAVLFHLLRTVSGIKRWVNWMTAGCFVLLWLPVGAAHLPIVAYVRGVSSDLSLTLVALACLGLWQGLSRRVLAGNLDKKALFVVIVAAGAFLYPTALGWGDWDAYRLGWGSYGMLLGLLALVFAFWYQGLRLLPMLVALAILGWVAGVMESGNLWDYLMDPWLVIFAFLEYPVKKLLKIIDRGELV